jgi:DNA-binding XRE family transcriptional regulator
MARTYVSSIPAPILPNQFIGPLSPNCKVDREHHSHHLNHTCSLMDHIYGKTIEAKTEEEYQCCTSPRYLVSNYNEQIEQHIERRVIFFWHQLLAVYGTRLHFEIGPTMDQAESAPSLDIKHQNTTRKLSTRNAAHSSTFPCLLACSIEDWEKHISKKTPKPQTFVFLKGSDLYKNSNATIDMLRDINEADSQLDGTHHNSAFSNQSMELLNQASLGLINPEDALKTFVKAATQMTVNKLKEPLKDGVKTALELYQNKLEDIQDTLKTDPDWFYHHLDVSIPDDKSNCMKSMILRIRCQAIRANLLGQAQIAAKIEVVKNQIFKSIKLQNIKKPAALEDAFRHLIIQSMTTEKDKERIIKFFAIPPESYNLRATKGRMQRLTKAKEKLMSQISIIQSLAKELKMDMYHMRVAQERQRGDSMRSLRFAKNWTQKELGNQIKRSFPQEPASQATVSRCERGERLISIDLAQKLSKVFNISPGLLLPQFFND